MKRRKDGRWERVKTINEDLDRCRILGIPQLLIRDLDE